MEFTLYNPLLKIFIVFSSFKIKHEIVICNLRVVEQDYIMNILFMIHVTNGEKHLCIKGDSHHGFIKGK